MDATHLNCPACGRIRPLRFEPLLPGEPSLGAGVCCAHCRQHAFTLLPQARFYCDICDEVQPALLERVNTAVDGELGVLRREGDALRLGYPESLRRRRGVPPACSRAALRSCSARMISIAFSNTARGGPDLPLIQTAT